RAALAAERPLQVVGCVYAYAARMAERVGFKAIYLSGGGVAAGSLGLPDLGISTLDDVLTDVRRITAVSDLPLLVDADTGFGRAGACVEAGADMIFPEAVAELAVYRDFAAAVGVPILANITEFGATPLFTVEQLAGAGVSVVLYPLSAFRAMNGAALEVYRALRRDGTQQRVVGLMQTRAELYEFLDYHAYEQKLDELFAREKE